jgi:hypothetical protein
LRESTEVEIDDAKLESHTVTVPEGGKFSRSGALGIPSSGNTDAPVIPSGKDAIQIPAPKSPR